MALAHGGMNRVFQLDRYVAAHYMELAIFRFVCQHLLIFKFSSLIYIEAFVFSQRNVCMCFVHALF